MSNAGHMVWSTLHSDARTLASPTLSPACSPTGDGPARPSPVPAPCSKPPRAAGPTPADARNWHGPGENRPRCSCGAAIQLPNPVLSASRGDPLDGQRPHMRNPLAASLPGGARHQRLPRSCAVLSATPSWFHGTAAAARLAPEAKGPRGPGSRAPHPSSPPISTTLEIHQLRRSARRKHTAASLRCSSPLSSCVQCRRDTAGGSGGGGRDGGMGVAAPSLRLLFRSKGRPRIEIQAVD